MTVKLRMCKNIYMIGNAHLDPVWMWRWQEGAAEVRATLRSALDRMKEFPEFRFTCSSAMYFMWLSECDSEMLEEIKTRVTEGRFIIVGGWIIQPDCNIPSGESFARQSLLGQRFFRETFGVTAKVGYNVDSFGHNAMIPQILNLSGMHDYIMMRPNPLEKKLPSNLFRWQSPDGSEVLTYRIPEPYCFNFSTKAELYARLRLVSALSLCGGNETFLFYGVGNHGGGPTIRNLRLMRGLAKMLPGTKLHYSDPIEFFDEVRRHPEYDIPVLHDDLQHHASGCYSAVSHIKRDNRRCEHGLLSAETLSVVAERLSGRAYPAADLKRAWLNVLFNQFHDIMGGCSIRTACEDARIMAGESLAIAQKNTAFAVQSIAARVQTADAFGQPVIVFNPNFYPVTVPVSVNTAVSKVWDAEHNEIPCQCIRSEAETCMRRGDTLFTVSLPPCGYATYYLKPQRSFAFMGVTLKLKQRPNPKAYKTGLTVSTKHIENDYLRVDFDTNGHICGILDKTSARQLVEGECIARVMDESAHDTWSHRKNFFDKEVGKFSCATLRVTETGPVRVSVEAVSTFGDSTLTEVFSLVYNEKMLRVKATVAWHEKHRMLKLCYPLKLTDTKVDYEIPFGHFTRPADNEEEPQHGYLVVRGTEGATAVLNDSKYSASVIGHEIRFTAVRSPIYGDHGGPRYSDSIYTDQGAQTFNYAILPTDEGFAEVTRAAKLMNAQPEVLVESLHTGRLPTTYSGLTVDCPHVMISALKKSEDGAATVVRVYELDGVQTDYTLTGDLLPTGYTGNIGAYKIQTLYITPDGNVTQTLLTEYTAEDQSGQID